MCGRLFQRAPWVSCNSCQLQREYLGVRDRCNIDQNVSGGVRYLAWLMRQFHGDLRLVAAAYYAGENIVWQDAASPIGIAMWWTVRRQRIRANYLRQAGIEDTKPENYSEGRYAMKILEKFGITHTRRHSLQSGMGTGRPAAGANFQRDASNLEASHRPASAEPEYVTSVRVPEAVNAVVLGGSGSI